jgi:mannosylglycerate hydrolase
MTSEPIDRRAVHVVPHTHWDREWYEPYQTFRLRLVDLLDDLLPRLDRDPSYAHFLLDGQMAVVDDYLAVRPQAEPVLRRLATSGRLAMGPWYILMDEFLVSGETMIRNLQLGLDRAAAFGGAMEVGYLPDMFGHVAQMPQLLAQFGFAHAVVWRGVPEHMRTTAFWWESPDGSVVRAQYLPDGYSNGATLPDDAKELIGLMARFEATYGTLAGGRDDGPLLWMNGTDHQMPRPWLGRVVAEANTIGDDYAIEVGSMADYLAAAPTEGLDRVVGELRSGARANLLMGVASNRVDIHQASAAGERALERLAEPLSALWLAPDRWPGALLDEAWLAMIRNSAHDSVCACSVDEVSDAVTHRYAEARQIAEGLTTRAVAALGRSVGGDRTLAVNPSARPRSGLVEMAVVGTDIPAGAQVLASYVAERTLEGVTRAQAVGALTGLLYNANDLIDGGVEVDEDGVLELRMVRDPVHATGTWSGPARTELADLAAADPDGPARVVWARAAGAKAVVRVQDVPGFGWRRIDPAAEAARIGTGPGRVVPVTVDGLSLTNGLVTVAIDEATGTFSIDGQPGFGRLVDDGDAGDTYNWCPPETDRVVEAPEDCSAWVPETGPLRARAKIRSTYAWSVLIDRSLGTTRHIGRRRVEITTTIEIRAGEALVRVTTELDNRCRDHRLRVWFPLPEPTNRSRAECAFAEVERGLTAEGGPNEWGVPTFPSRRFVQAGGLTVVHDGLLEYELVDIRSDDDTPLEASYSVEASAQPDDARAHALALTLLRCTGIISQGPMASRPWPAGPPTPVEGPQMIGTHTLRYAVQVGPADPYALVDDAFLELAVADPAKIRGMAAAGATAGTDDATGQALSITGAEVSSVRRVGGRLEVRVWNPSDHPTTVELAGRSGWLVDLRGAPVAAFTETVELGPWRIATLVIDE